MLERRILKDHLVLGKQRINILLNPDRWKQKALSTIVSRARFETALDEFTERPIRGAGQPNSTSRNSNGRSLWFSVEEPTESQPATVTINGGKLLRHRTVTITEEDGRLSARVENIRKIGITPKIVYLRRLYHAFNGELKRDPSVTLH